MGRKPIDVTLGDLEKAKSLTDLDVKEVTLEVQDTGYYKRDRFAADGIWGLSPTLIETVYNNLSVLEKSRLAVEYSFRDLGDYLYQYRIPLTGDEKSIIKFCEMLWPIVKRLKKRVGSGFFQLTPQDFFEHQITKDERLKPVLRDLQESISAMKRKLDMIRLCGNCQALVIDPKAKYCGICGTRIEGK
jgi:hypothetical protein